MKHRRSSIRLLSVFVLIVGSTALAMSQDSPTIGEPLPLLGTGGENPGLFGTNAARSEVSAEVGSWEPETGVGILAVDVQFPEGYHQTDSPDFFTIDVIPVPGITFAGVVKPEPTITDDLPNFYDSALLAREFHVAEGTGPVDFSVTAKYQICDENGTCLFPDQEELLVTFDPSSPPIDPKPELAEVMAYAASVAESPAVGIDDPVSSTGGERGGAGRLLYFALFALLGGILLNIMPCVLPLLSVKALGLVRQAGQDRRAVLAHSWLYVAGIEVSFLALAAVVTILKASGSLLGWGFQFQDPRFVLVLAAIIWVFALSLFDLYVIQAPKVGVEGASHAGARGGYLGSFATGIFAVLVATPCTAPFLGAALGFAFSQPAPVIFFLFAVTGLGLGLPFLLLGIWPGVIKKLPKPGAWMNTFKIFMGFLLAGTTVYLLTTFNRQAASSLPGVLWWFLILTFAAWLFGLSRNPTRKKPVRIAGSIVALALAIVSAPILITLPEKGATVPASSERIEVSDAGVIPFSEETVESLIAEGTPVFLEFTANWCTTCKVNQRVLKAPSVRGLMDSHGIVFVKGDLTSYDETMTRWLGRFGRAGVPLYVLFRPGEEPVVFPELITREMIEKEILRLPVTVAVADN